MMAKTTEKLSEGSKVVLANALRSEISEIEESRKAMIELFAGQAGIRTEGLTDTKYGWKITLSKNMLIVCIYPGRDTGLAAQPGTLDEFGLRPHPGELWEHVTYLGCFDGLDEEQDTPMLYYNCKAQNDKGNGIIKTRSVRKGQSFYSVECNGEGYCHTLENPGLQVNLRPIVLLIKMKNQDEVTRLERKDEAKRQ